MDQAANYMMDTVEQETVEELTTAACPDHLPLPYSPLMDGVNGEPLVCPRIGDEYQVEIPVLATESESSQLKEVDVSFDIDTAMGLEIPVMWVCHQSSRTRREKKKSPVLSDGNVIAGSMRCTETEDMLYDVTLEKKDRVHLAGTIPYIGHPQHYSIKGEFDVKPCCKGSEEQKIQNFSTVDNKPDIGIPMMHLSVENIYTALPGSPASSWSDPESQSFVLGLYIFGKDLVQVRKFIECKKMGDILSYYYGKFYRSEAYRKWLECRKIRSRRCILGNRIFTGWRQQELLSRILPTVPKDVQDTIIEVTKSFNDGRASLDDLVSNLKNKVGIQVLVEAIGIGKEKHDLTRLALDPSRSNQGLPICPEIPTGKACSSLSADDIIKFLTGDFRLSKAKSNDLFWEAVWPRLLARGWHSEQPKDFISIGSKNSLVFITPGVKKFSRKKHVKGNHYFDSISDVLSKVASDPKLLELEAQGTGFKEESGCLDNKGHQTDLSTQPEHRYLRPRVPDGYAECMKFTVVDTSLFQDGGPRKLRELRTLPVDAVNFPMNDVVEAESESSSEDQDSDDISSDDQGVSAPTISCSVKNAEQSMPLFTEKAPFSALSDNIDPSGKISTMNGQIENNEYTHHLGVSPHGKNINCQFSDRKISEEQAYLAPVTKKMLIPSNYELSSQQAYSSNRVQFSVQELNQQLGAVRHAKSILALPHPSKSTLFPKFTSCYNTVEDNHSSGEDHIESSPVESTSVAKPPQSHTLIDLNILPHSSYEQETDESFRTDASPNNLEVNLAGPSKDSEEEPASHDSEATYPSMSTAGNQHGSGNFRRQSSRNRPPTTKALESLACGFIGTKRKGRDYGDILSGFTNSRTARRVRKTVEAPTSVTPPSVVGYGSSPEVPNATENITFQSSLVSNSYVEPDTKMQDDMPGVP